MDLSYTRLGNEAGYVLARVLRTNPKLTKLNIQNTEITISREIASSLNDNTRLVDLELDEDIFFFLDVRKIRAKLD